MAAPTGETELAWIVCLDGHREVVAGVVFCPLAGADLRARDCLDCRHLSHVPEERRTSLWCSTGPS